MMPVEVDVTIVFETRHISVERVADGVWAALHRDGGWAVANAGIVDLGGCTLLFDAGLTTAAAHDLRSAAQALTGRAPDVVALSHFHNDHARGTELFAEVPLVATEGTRRLLDDAGRSELVGDRANAAARLEHARSFADAEDAAERAFATTFVPYWEALVASAPSAAVRLPDVTFRDEVTFHGARRAATMRHVGAAHTLDDAVLSVEDAGVVFCGDLLFVAAHPYLADGAPEGWLDALERLAATGARHFVPGHGPVGTLDDVWTLHAHLRGLLETAQRLHRDGGAVDEHARLSADDPAARWSYALPFHAANLRFLVQRAAGG